MGVDQTQGIRFVERGHADGQRVECGTERIQVGTGVHGPVHSPGQLRRHRGEGTKQVTMMDELKMLLGKRRGQIEIDDL